MKKIDIFLICMFLLFVGLVIYVLNVINKDVTKCIADPISYGVIALSKQIENNLSCACFSPDYKYHFSISTNNETRPLFSAEQRYVSDINYTSLNELFR